MMKHGWTSYLVAFLLLGLLVVLAFLQYQWLGQISEAESIRLSKRVADDTQRFARDFDGLIQKTFIALQIDARDLDGDDLRGFQKRVLFLRQQGGIPNLIKTIYYDRSETGGDLVRFDEKNAKFVSAEWPATLDKIQRQSPESLNSMKIVGDIMVTPLFYAEGKVQEIVVRDITSTGKKIQTENLVNQPKKSGALYVELDRDTITNVLIPGLVKKYFEQDSGVSFEISITDENGQKIFATTKDAFLTGDSTARFYRLTSDDVFVFARQDNEFIDAPTTKVRSRVILSETRKKNESNEDDEKILSIHTGQKSSENAKISVIKSGTEKDLGQWILNVRHSSGSLDTFITNTRYKNLAISFGILGVLAAGLILIVVSTHRAKALAQKQMDFVSSVSHEFRTPLAVIYSAGENITDGVVLSDEKLSSYGELIKREGRKLSRMVEQVLEYAGANSQGRTYKFDETEINSVIASSISEFDSLIRESGFLIETDLTVNLPKVSVDKEALAGAFQNLIANGIKYSNGSNWLKISSSSKDGWVSVLFEDQGIGISQADLKQVFEPFFRSQNVIDDQISGNGLGLSLVKEIIEAHGGLVTVSSEEGIGSVFTLMIPVKV